jgi:hypothetical protein
MRSLEISVVQRKGWRGVFNTVLWSIFHFSAFFAPPELLMDKLSLNVLRCNDACLRRPSRRHFSSFIYLRSAQITLHLLLSPHLLHFHSFNNPSNHGISFSSSKSVGGGSQSAKKSSRRSHDTNPNAPASIGTPISSRWVPCWSLWSDSTRSRETSWTSLYS